MQNSGSTCREIAKSCPDCHRHCAERSDAAVHLAAQKVALLSLVAMTGQTNKNGGPFDPPLM